MSDFKVGVVGDIGKLPPHEAIELGRMAISDPRLSDSDAIILAGDTVADLFHLRRNNETQFLPVYALDESIATEALCDGPVPQDLHQVLLQNRQNLAGIAEETFRSPEHAPLRYLWTLESRALAPALDLNTSSIYSYPQISMFDIREPERWLAQAERRGWIQRDRVVDRTRNCSGCGGAHLNYIDRCPNCDSLDIVEEQTLHCFVCGVVEAQALFERGDKLVCPKCQSDLKHIGTDYDRPLEPLRCGDCNTRFMEARIKAACLECGELNLQSSLSVRLYSAYSLGPVGADIVRTGSRDPNIPQQLDTAVEREHFLWSMQWLWSLEKSQEDQPLLIKVAREDPSNSDIPSGELRTSWENISTHVRRLLNPAEIRHCFDGHTLVFLVPTGSEARLNELVKQIGQISDAQISINDRLLVTGHRFPPMGFGGEPAAWLEGIAARTGQR